MNLFRLKVAENRGNANGVGLWRENSQDRLPLPPEEPENERDDDGDDDAGAKGEIEGKVFPFDIDVAGEFSQPGEFAGKGNDCADYCDHKSDDNQPLPLLLHGQSPLLPGSRLVPLFFAVDAAAVLLTVKPQLFRD